MTFTLTIDCDNDALQHSAYYAEGVDHQAVAALLRDAADRLDNGDESGTVRDSNGNTVGSWSFTDAGDHDYDGDNPEDMGYVPSVAERLAEGV